MAFVNGSHVRPFAEWAKSSDGQKCFGHSLFLALGEVVCRHSERLENLQSLADEFANLRLGQTARFLSSQRRVPFHSKLN